jgi:hypothetical protein
MVLIPLELLKIREKHALWKILWRKSWAKEHTVRRHLKNILYENHLKIKNKPNQESFKLCIQIYRMNLSTGLPNLVRLSL